MHRILITGGTGTLGKEIVRQLLGKGYFVDVLSSRKNPNLPLGARVFTGDLMYRASIGAAVAHADVIVHCASNSQNAKEVDIEGTKNLIASVRKEQLKHFIYISIAGVDKSSFPYYKVKYEVEKIIQESTLPFTNLRATQFHHFVLHRIIGPSHTGGSVIKVPKGLRFQSIDIKDVANRVIELIAGGPTASTITIGGPEILTIEDMTHIYLQALGRTDRAESVESDLFSVFKTGVNLCPECSYGTITWEQFVRERTE